MVKLIGSLALGIVWLTVSHASSTWAAERTSQTLYGVEVETSLDLLIARAQEANPTLLWAEAQLESRRAALPESEVLPGLDLGYDYFVKPVETRTGPQRFSLRASQALPQRGARGFRRGIAEGDVSIAAQRVEAARLRVAFEVRQHVHELLYLQMAKRLTEENSEILRRFEQIARTRYKVDAARHPDLIRIQLEMGRVEDQRRHFVESYDAQMALLNGLLDQSPFTKQRLPRELPDELLDLERDELMLRLGATVPSLAAVETKLERQQEVTKLAQLSTRPRYSVGLTYNITGEPDNPNTRDAGEDSMKISFGMKIPLTRKALRAKAATSESQARSLRAEQSVEQNRLRTELSQAHYEHIDAHRRAMLYSETLIPKTTESLRSSVIAFSTATGDFLELLDTERTLREFQLAYERARADRGIALARLEYLVAEDLPKRRVAGEPLGVDR